VEGALMMEGVRVVVQVLRPVHHQPHLDVLP